METFLNCPSCGRKPTVEDGDTLYPVGRDPDGEWDFICNEVQGGCGLTVFGKGRAGAIAAWNRRPDQPLTMKELTFLFPYMPTVSPTGLMTVDEEWVSGFASNLNSCTLPNPSPITYKVKPGDTLSEIVYRFYGTVSILSAFISLNRAAIEDPGIIFPGDEYVLPGSINGISRLRVRHET